jgi:subtilisin family serine protease
MPLPLASRLLGGSAIAAAVLLSACADQQAAGPSYTAPVRPALTLSQPTGRPDRYLVSFKGVEPATFAAQVKTLGGTIERRLPGLRVATVSGLGSTGATTLAKTTGVEFLAQDLVVQFIPAPNLSSSQLVSLANPGPKTQGTDQSGAFFYGTYQWNIRQVSANLAWGSTPGGQGELVCVLDTGIDPDHLDLNGKVDPTLLTSFISSPLFAGDLDPLDYNFHGTATAAYITTNGLGVASVAPDARLCSAKTLNVLGSGSFADLISAIAWAADNKADVINMSSGGYIDQNLPGGEFLVKLTQRAVDYATDRGSVLVAAAGNSGINLDEDASNFLFIPGQLRNVVSVGATAPFNQTNFDGLASYSNFGGKTGVDLMAPGGDGLSGNILDYDITACSEYQLTLPFACGYNSYVFVTGTSESSPHVAGAAAVVESKTGQRAPASTVACLLKGTDIIGPSRTFGAGRLNVAKAATCL